MTLLTAQLTDMAQWSHHFAREILQPGDLAIDLTAGRGYDSLFLAQCVDSNSHGSVLAFDIQPEAVASTLERLENNHITASRITRPQQIEGPGVFLLTASHERLALFVPRPPKVIMANLGYLPGGDHTIATQAQSSLPAIKTALEELATGGRLIVVVYIGHDQGREESQAIAAELQRLQPRDWHVIKMVPFICTQAPYLLVVEKRREKMSQRDLLLRS